MRSRAHRLLISLQHEPADGADAMARQAPSIPITQAASRGCRSSSSSCCCSALFMCDGAGGLPQPFIYTTFLSTAAAAHPARPSGLTFVIGAGEIDLSFPASSASPASSSRSCSRNTISAGWRCLAALAAGVLVGFVNGILSPRSASLLHRHARHPVLLVRHGDRALRRQLLCAARCREPSVWHLIVGRPFAGRRPPGSARLPLQAFWALLIVVFLWFVLNRHRFGEHRSSSAIPTRSSRVVGIDVDREKIKIFTLMGAARRASPRSC